MSLELKKESKSIVAEKAYAFALLVISIYKELKTENEFILSRQILRSGTSIGANVNEAISAESKKDFVHKLSISLKEARETKYWLNLLKDSNFIHQEMYNKSNKKCEELIKILSSIILTTKQRYLNNS
ncbi:four helix bundle protein [Ichthyenterobacterium magnum]|uniref:Four helix bundle protein n=1 Tax=Ichthyenterobacterium magnum TaxID=1230530 RepID=A0A420DLS3_9FLAO|nr:four helix bundle protein [Ichthyenterobacterium magnum]RKE95148.1 four helix bundle protein [Ichthyenterobacterium magnum]